MRPFQATIATGLCVLLLWGCDQRRSDAESAAVQTPPALSTLPPPGGFIQAATCSALGVYDGPGPGSTYVYRRQDGSLSSRQIASATQGRVVFRYRDLSDPSHVALPDRVALAGVYVFYDDASPRTVDYKTDPVAAIAALKPGETATIPTTETSTIRGKTRRIDFPTVTTYRMCGDLTVQGRNVPVRVYDVSTSRRVVNRSGGDQVRSSRVTYYLSAETGYPLAFQDTATTVIDRIEGSP